MRVASFVRPVGIVGVLEVPERPAACDDGRGLENCKAAAARSSPTRASTRPTVVPHALTSPQGDRNVDEEDEDRGGLKRHAERGDEVPEIPAASAGYV